jgi:hypothetical protein
MSKQSIAINPDYPPPELAERFAKTVPEFQANITTIAQAAQLPPLKVFALWREYTEECNLRDQSPVLGEFQQWYADFLTPERAA